MREDFIMVDVTEATFKHGSATFYSKTWTPHDTIKAKLIFVHGFSEHVNRYNLFFPKLAAHGIQVFSWDQRGWGRSATKSWQKGLTGPTEQVIADVAAFIRDKLPSIAVGREEPAEAGKHSKVQTPVFVMGHSMGGGEILTLAGDVNYADLVVRVRGWIVESPLIGFPTGEEPSSIMVIAGRLIGRLLPKQQLKHVLPAERLSRDAAVVESVLHDPLCHDTGTLEGLASLLDRTTMLSSGQVRLGKHVNSIFLAHGTGDKICSCEEAQRFVERQTIEDKTTKTYPGAYHQLHADHCADEFAKDVVDWILQRCPGYTGAKL